MTLTEKTGHLAWCALVALALARQEQGELSPAQENLFLTRWLAAALKQRRFSRDVAQDIGWLLNQGRLLGVRAKLADKLGYVWRSCSGELTEQNDMFRLTYALETAKDMGWNYRVMSDREGTVAKLAMRQPFVLFKGLTFQKLCLPGAFRPGDHHNKMLRPGLCVVHASPQYL
ncbi:DUF2913 family protein [Klebsiella pneumoniae]|uniref:DUF2913 family protein n=2 Tax=Klebsiella pneumoniae TaxID=573 RepID=UPI003CFD4998